MDPSLTLLLIATTIAILLWRKKQKERGFRFPPSPPSFPIFGHLHLLGDLPHQSLHKLARKYGGLMYLKLGSVHALIASSPEAAKEVLKNQDQLLASRPVVSTSEYFGYNSRDVAWAPYGEYWRSIRKLCTLELLTVKRVEMLKPVRRAEVSQLLREILEACKAQKPVHLRPKLSDSTFNTMTRLVMNKSFRDGSSEAKKALCFKDTVSEIFTVASGIHVGDFIPSLRFLDTQMPKIKVLKARMDEYLQEVVEEHKRNWKEKESKDFIDVMLSAGVEDELMIKALVLDMLAAGTDTSWVTVEWAMAELLRNPVAMRKVVEEIDGVVGKERTMEEDDVPKLEYLQAVVKETLRLQGPAPLMLPHEATADFSIGSYRMPKGTRVFVNVFAVGRDPSVWQEPDKFDPGRFLGAGASLDVKGQSYEVLPFGSGRRMCPGISLALAMVHLALGSLLHAFEWSVPGGEELDMSEAFGLTVPRKVPLVLSASPRLNESAY